MGIAEGLQIGAGIMRDIDRAKAFDVEQKRLSQQANVDAEKTRKQDLVAKIKIYADAAKEAIVQFKLRDLASVP
jgi:hypothetical protein